MESIPIFKDICDVHARLFDHRAVLQGEANFFVQRFESTTGTDAADRLQHSLELTREVNEEMLDKCVPALKNQLEKFNDNVIEAVQKLEATIESETLNPEDDWLNERRKKRVASWREFMDDMCVKSSAVDEYHEDEIKKIEKYYTDLESKLQP